MELSRIVVNQVFIMFLLIGVGFVLYQLKLISDQTNKQLASIVLYVVSPALILNTYQMDFNPKDAKNMLLGFLLSFVSIFLAILLSQVLRVKGKKESISTERFCVIFSNCGFMAIPLLNALFGEIGIFYCNTYITVFNLVLWTYGIGIMQKNQGRERKSFSHRVKPFLTPTMFSIVIGLFLYFFQIKFPAPIREATKFIADMNTPLAMIVCGVYIAQSDFLSALKKWRVYLIVALKGVFLPFIIIGVFYFLPLDNMLRTTIVITASCPTGATAILIASGYKGDVERASNVFAISTLFSIITLPLVVLISQWMI